MALTADEQRLVDWAKAQLPEWFSHGEREEEYLGALAKMHGQGLTLAQNWLGQTMILVAVGPTGGDADWLDMHAGERDTRRASGEADPSLRIRIRSVADVVTRPVLLAEAQAIVDLLALPGTPAVFMAELTRDQAYFGDYAADAGIGGGTFADEGGGVYSFTPTTPFARPVLGHPQSTHFQNPQLVIASATAPANDGTFPATGLSGDAVLFANAGVAGVDGAAVWSLQKLDPGGNTRDGRSKAYFGRGYRMHGGPARAAFVMILPYGCTAATSAAVTEMLRKKKGAGATHIVECRLNP